MEFVADEHVPAGVCWLIRNFGHTIVRSKDMIGEKWPDESVVQLADHLGAIVITWNQKDFDKVLRPRLGKLRYPRAGALYFAVAHADADTRLWQVMDLVAYEIQAAELRERPCLMKVTRENFQVFR